VDTEEARALTKDNPLSFLRVARAEVDLPPEIDPYSDTVYARAKENFAAFQRSGVLVREPEPCLYFYLLRMGQHVQTGLVACCHIEDYEQGIIRKHEKTRVDKETDRVRHLQAIQANSGPVFLAYRDVRAIDAIAESAMKEPPLYNFTAVDGVGHTVWKVAAPAALVEAFRSVPLSYIADGHHRAAAAARAGAELRRANARHLGSEEYNWFLAVLFPAGQLQILPYNRVVKDLNGLSASGFLDVVRRRFTLVADAPAKPEAARNVSIRLGDRWYGIRWDEHASPNPVETLDVQVLQDRLLAPVLGIRDPRTDKRIEFVGGIRGVVELERRVESGKAAVAFSMHPVGMNDVMAIADASQIMPPKSTWFEPKLRSGLLVHTLF
jgi:uncharacterized protein (DUF1015 family)